MLIHYENNSPFLTVTHLERTIEVSHWGVISVEEVVDLIHTGAILKGPFSRYEFQRETQSGVSSVKSFKVTLIFCCKYLLSMLRVPRQSIILSMWLMVSIEGCFNV